MAQSMIRYTLLDLQIKFPHLGLTLADTFTIYRVCTKYNTDPIQLLGSQYTAQWIAATRLKHQLEASTLLQMTDDPMQEETREKNRKMCSALEKLCVRIYTVDRTTLQHKLQQACGPDPTVCFGGHDCRNSATIPCRQQCWQVFYCSHACKQRDCSSHSETCAKKQQQQEEEEEQCE